MIVHSTSVDYAVTDLARTAARHAGDVVSHGVARGIGGTGKEAYDAGSFSAERCR